MLTLEEYLNYEVESDRRYEIEGGEILEMPPESFANDRLALWLMLELTKVINYTQITNKAEIIVSGRRVNARIPNTMILTPEGVACLMERSRATILIDEPPPFLVVEVVSPGKEAANRDYRYKRSEYAARGIEHYWIVDPQQNKFTVLKLVEGFYEAKEYDFDEAIALTEPFALTLNLINYSQS